MPEDKKINVLIYVPSFLGTMDVLTVESLGYLLFDCYNWKAQGYEFYFMIGKRMNTHDSRNHAALWAVDNDMDYILWFDDDMVIDKVGKPVFTTLIAHDKDFVAPLFFQRRPPYLPLLFKRNKHIDGAFTTYDNILDYEKGLLEVDGVGFGCCLTKVDMFKKIPKPYFLMGETFGEDLFFCDKAINAGYKIFCDTTIQIGHISDPPVAWESSYEAHKDAAKLHTDQKKEKDKAYMRKLGGEVDICMPIYHNFEATKNAIESILNYTHVCTWTLNLVIDGADKEVEKYVKSIAKYRDNVKYIVNKKSQGCIKASNQVMSMATNPYVCLVNNDIVVPRNMSHWLHRLITFAKADDVGAVAPVSDYVMGIQNVTYNSKIIGNVCDSTFLIPFCTVFKKEVLDKVGLFDERFQLENGSSGDGDLDMSIRIRDAGYRLVIVRDVFIHHEGSKSLDIVNDGNENTIKTFEKTRQILIDKWGQSKVDDLVNIRLV